MKTQIISTYVANVDIVFVAIRAHFAFYTFHWQTLAIAAWTPAGIAHHQTVGVLGVAAQQCDQGVNILHIVQARLTHPRVLLFLFPIGVAEYIVPLVVKVADAECAN